MTFDEHRMRQMKYMDDELDDRELAEFETHLAECESCRKALGEFSKVKEVTDSMKIADLPEAVWEKYWDSVYNRLERSVAWFLFIAGALILNLYWLYRVITEPNIDNIVSFGTVLMVAGLAILFLSVLREKMAVNKTDKYISEVKR